MAYKWPEHGYLEVDAENYYYWKCSRLWKLSETMEIEHVPLESFDWTNSNFQCNAFSKQPLWREVGNQIKQTLAADLQYPIVISADGDIMDGMHRVLKSYAFGLPTVKAVRFKETPPPDMVVPKSEVD